MSVSQGSSASRNRASHIYDASYEEGIHTNMIESGKNFCHHCVLLQVQYFMSAQKNGGIAHNDLISHSVVLFRLDTHLLFSQMKSTHMIPMKQLEESCDLLGKECFQKKYSRNGMYIS